MQRIVRHPRSTVYLLGIAALIIFSVAYVDAQESTITFPVAELGNCESKEACHTYCDNLNHVSACVAFAEAHNLMSAKEATAAREFARLGGKGPGGCTSKDACENYCEDTAHMRQCLNFAKQAGLMDTEELQEAEKVAAYLEGGGIMPGGCRGERECRAYCEEGGHMKECAEFAIKAGFMSEKEAEMFRKTGGVGPGGCHGKACEAFCEDEANREQCIAFSMEHGLMSEEDKQRMEEGKQKAMEALEKAPPAVLSCIETALGAERVAQLKRGEGVVSPKLGQILPQCFREAMGDQSRGGPFGSDSEATDCMRKVFGDDFEEKMSSGELDPGARDNEIRECMQEQMGEGFLNDQGQWERPEPGDPSKEGENAPPMMRDEGDTHRQFENEYQRQYNQEYEAKRREIEMRMRAEIESQMRSGNFDPSKLPPDFRPEGMFPPPESFQRPPEGMYPQSGTMPPQGYMPPDGQMIPPHDGSYPEGALPPGSYTPPEGSTPPPDMQQAPPPPTSEPVSMLSPLVASVFSILMSIIHQMEPPFQ